MVFVSETAQVMWSPSLSRSEFTKAISPVDYHSILGESLLPQSLSALLGFSLHGSPTPKAKYANATHELLRAAANFCMDHGSYFSNYLTCNSYA